MTVLDSDCVHDFLFDDIECIYWIVSFSFFDRMKIVRFQLSFECFPSVSVSASASASCSCLVYHYLVLAGNAVNCKRGCEIRREAE